MAGMSDRRIILRNTGRLLAALAAATAIASAGTISYTGTLGYAEDDFDIAVVLASPGTITLQTYSFGGGTNSDGTMIAAGGFDPFLALFDGTGSGATLIDGSSDILSNYSSFEGCPPAGTVTVGSIGGQCGDVRITESLAAGTYTIFLSDAEYFPNAVFDNGDFLEGFTDLTGGIVPLQTCADANDCNQDTSFWSLDVTEAGPEAPPGVPEPAAWGLTAFGLLAMALRFRAQRRIQ